MYFWALLEGSSSDMHCLRSREAGEYLDICFWSLRPTEGAVVPWGFIFYPRHENFQALTSSSALSLSEIWKETRKVRLSIRLRRFIGVRYLLQALPVGWVAHSREPTGLVACSVSAGLWEASLGSASAPTLRGKVVSMVGSSRAVWRLKGRICAWFLFRRNEVFFFPI